MTEKTSSHTCQYTKEIIGNEEQVKRISKDQEKILEALSDVKEKAFSNNSKVSNSITILNTQFATLTDILRANTNNSNKMAEGLTVINACILAIDKKMDGIEHSMNSLQTSHSNLTSEVSNLKANIYPRISRIEKIRITAIAVVLGVTLTVTVIFNLDNLYNLVVKHKKPNTTIEKVECVGSDTAVSK